MPTVLANSLGLGASFSSQGGASGGPNLAVLLSSGACLRKDYTGLAFTLAAADDSLAMCMWVKFGVAVPEDYVAVMSLGQKTGGFYDPNYFQTYADPPPFPNWRLTVDNGQDHGHQGGTDFPLDDGQWHFIAQVYDYLSPGQMRHRLFVDAVHSVDRYPTNQLNANIGRLELADRTSDARIVGKSVSVCGVRIFRGSAANGGMNTAGEWEAEMESATPVNTAGLLFQSRLNGTGDLDGYSEVGQRAERSMSDTPGPSVFA